MVRMTKFVAFLAIMVLIGNACQKTASSRKIRLSETSTTLTRTQDRIMTTIHLEPSQQRSIAVMFFKNKTGDENLEWLQQGLSEMFIRSLSQSRHLSVLGQDRLVEIMSRLNTTTNEPVDMDLAAIVAQEANVEVLLKGNISKNGETLRLDVQLIEPFQGLVLRDESIEGTGMETILSMVDQLSNKIQNDLQSSLESHETLKGIAELSTHSLEAWQQFTLGEDLCNQLLVQEAIGHFIKAIKLDSTFVSPYLRLYQCYSSQGDNESAYSVYQTAERLKNKATKNEQYKLELTRAALNGEIEHLIKLQKEWIQENPNDLQAIQELGNYYFGLRNYDQAIEYYEKTYDLDPKYKLTLNQLGYCYALTGDYKKAIAILDEYRKAVPDEPNPYDSLGEIYLFQGDYTKAAKYFKMAVEKNRVFTASLDHLANTAADRGDYKKAIEYYRTSIIQQPEGVPKSNILYEMAGLYQRMGNTEKAVQNYRASMDVNIYQWRSPRQLSGIYKDQGDSVQARKVLMNHFNNLRNDLTSDLKKQNYFHLLAIISLSTDMERESTIRLIDSTMAVLVNPIHLFRAKFLKTILLMQGKEYDKIDRVWNYDFQHQFLSVMQNVKNVGYSDIWEYFHFMNDYFYGDIKTGIKVYSDFIEATHRLESSFYETGFRNMLADLYWHTGNISLAEEQMRFTGIPVDTLWTIIGPFDNKDGFNRSFPPEKTIDLRREYRHKRQIMQWKRADDGYLDGYVNLENQFTKSDWSVAYAVIHVECAQEKKVQFRIGANESIKIWLNGKEIWRLNRIQDAIIDDQITPVTLKAGSNEVLLKVCNRYAEWGFYFRITDEQGKGIPDIEYLPAGLMAGEVASGLSPIHNARIQHSDRSH